MSVKKFLLCGLMIAGINTALPVAFADEEIIVNTAPPALKSETIPGKRVGYVWDPGYWGWYQGEHVWTPGHWILLPKDYKESEWVPAHWEHRPDGRWQFVPEHWMHDL